jgi:hypothetical protein
MKVFKVLIVLTLLGLQASPAMAWVKSVSLERTFVGDNIRVLEVAVKCKLDNADRKLRKVVSSSKDWCSIDVPSICSERKVMAAREVCQYSRAEFQELIDSKGKPVSKVASPSKPAVAKVSPKKAAIGTGQSKDDLMQEKMLIEEQRIKIAQLQIELSRKELALKKELTSN